MSEESAWAVRPYLLGRNKARVILIDGRSRVLREPVGGRNGISSHESGSRTDAVPWTDVQVVQVPRSNVVAGGLIGAGVVGCAALLFGLEWQRQWCETDSPYFGQCEGTTGGLVAFTAAGASVGFVVGAIIGSLAPGWKTVYAFPLDHRVDAGIRLQPSDRSVGVMLTLTPG